MRLRRRRYATFVGLATVAGAVEAAASALRGVAGQFADFVAVRRAAWCRGHFSPVRLGRVPVLLVLPIWQWTDLSNPRCSQWSSAGWGALGRVTGAAAASDVAAVVAGPQWRLRAAQTPVGARCWRRNDASATGGQHGGRRELLLPPGRGKAGMGVECRHTAGLVSTPSPTLPLPGGGSQNIGRADLGGQAASHNAKRFVSHEPIVTHRPLAQCGQPLMVGLGPGPARHAAPA